MRSIAVPGVLVLFLTVSGTGRAESPAPAEAETATVEFFVMSKCPFAAQVLTRVAPVLAKMGESVRFRLGYIGTGKGDELRSLHGEPEVAGDKIWLCAERYHPGRYLDLVACMSENFRAIPDNLNACAEQVGFPVEDIRACTQGQEGAGLLRMSFDQAKQRRASGSPTMYIGGKLYRGARSEAAFTRAICGAIPGKKPAVCASLPPPVRVPVIVFSDARCKACDSQRLSRMVESMFPDARIREVDYTTGEGKKLYARLKPVLLPTLIFGKQAEKADSWDRIRRMVEERGEYYVLRRFGKWDPTSEVCDNGQDDTGNGLADCQDPDCRHTLACREKIPAKLEVFVMSQCPYAVRGLNAMQAVLQSFGDEMRFEIHFIADANPEGDGFRALHGQPEVDENIRELCAIKYYPDSYKYMDYIWCRGENIRSAEWAPCTGTNGIDTNMIEMCVQGGEGARLLRKDIQIAKGLGVTGSPTWLVNNKHKFNGIDATAIIDNFCKHNENLRGCRAR